MTKTNPEPTPISASELVREFHETYGQPLRTTPSLEVPELHMRMQLVAEEFMELVEAAYGDKALKILEPAWEEAIQADEGSRDIIEVVDALGDLIYVIYGFAHTIGVDLNKILDEIQSSNMSKVGADGKPIYRADGKILKGPNFVEPDISKILKKQGWVNEK